jgi:hypothetical protein
MGAYEPRDVITDFVKISELKCYGDSFYVNIGS